MVRAADCESLGALLIRGRQPRQMIQGRPKIPLLLQQEGALIIAFNIGRMVLQQSPVGLYGFAQRLGIPGRVFLIKAAQVEVSSGGAGGELNGTKETGFRQLVVAQLGLGDAQKVVQARFGGILFQRPRQLVAGSLEIPLLYQLLNGPRDLGGRGSLRAGAQEKNQNPYRNPERHHRDSGWCSLFPPRRLHELPVWPRIPQIRRKQPNR